MLRHVEDVTPGFPLDLAAAEADGFEHAIVEGSQLVAFRGDLECGLDEAYGAPPDARAP